MICDITLVGKPPVPHVMGLTRRMMGVRYDRPSKKAARLRLDPDYWHLDRSGVVLGEQCKD